MSYRGAALSHLCWSNWNTEHLLEGSGTSVIAMKSTADPVSSTRSLSRTFPFFCSTTICLLEGILNFMRLFKIQNYYLTMKHALWSDRKLKNSKHVKGNIKEI